MEWLKALTNSELVTLHKAVADELHERLCGVGVEKRTLKARFDAKLDDGDDDDDDDECEVEMLKRSPEEERALRAQLDAELDAYMKARYAPEPSGRGTKADAP